jgi:hypothetical protein
MGYTVHTDADRRCMLKAIGMNDVADLFAAAQSCTSPPV